MSGSTLNALPAYDGCLLLLCRGKGSSRRASWRRTFDGPKEKTVPGLSWTKSAGQSWPGTVRKRNTNVDVWCPSRMRPVLGDGSESERLRRERHGNRLQVGQQYRQKKRALFLCCGALYQPWKRAVTISRYGCDVLFPLCFIQGDDTYWCIFCL